MPDAEDMPVDRNPAVFVDTPEDAPGAAVDATDLLEWKLAPVLENWSEVAMFLLRSEGAREPRKSTLLMGAAPVEDEVEKLDVEVPLNSSSLVDWSRMDLRNHCSYTCASVPEQSTLSPRGARGM